MIKSLRALCFLMYDQVQGMSNERQHWYSLKAYSRTSKHYKKLFNLWCILHDIFRKHHKKHWVYDVFLFFVKDVHWSPLHCGDLLNSSRFYDIFLFFVTDVHRWILKPWTLQQFVKFVAIRPIMLWRFSRFVAINK
jgi:hypothetical protein